MLAGISVSGKMEGKDMEAETGQAGERTYLPKPQRVMVSRPSESLIQIWQNPACLCVPVVCVLQRF